MSEIKKLIGVLSKTYNKAESELSSTLLEGENFKEGAAEEIQKLAVAHYTSISEAAETKRKKDMSDQYGRGVIEAAEKFEKAIGEHIPGIDKTLKGDELLKQLPNAVNAIRTATDGPDKIKTSSTYMEGIKATEERKDAEWKQKLEEKETAFNKLQSERETEKVHTAINKEISAYVDTLKLRDDIDATVISSLKESAKQNLLSRKSKLSESGDVLFLDGNGEVAKDQLGNIIKLENLIKEAHQPLLKLTQASENRGDGGRPGENNGGTGAKTIEGYGLKKPTTVDEHSALLDTLNKMKNEGKISQDTLKSLVKEGSDSVQEAITKSQSS